MLGSSLSVTRLDTVLKEAEGRSWENLFLLFWCTNRCKTSAGFNWYPVTVIACACQNLPRALGTSFNSSRYSIPLSRQHKSKHEISLAFGQPGCVSEGTASWLNPDWAVSCTQATQPTVSYSESLLLSLSAKSFFLLNLQAELLR